MERIGFKTVIRILKDEDENFLKETRNHDKGLIKVIKLYCLLNLEDYNYNSDFYDAVDRYNELVEKENRIGKLIKRKPKPYISSWVDADFLGG